MSGPASGNSRVPWPRTTGTMSKVIASTRSLASSHRIRAPLPCTCSSPPVRRRAAASRSRAAGSTDPARCTRLLGPRGLRAARRDDAAVNSSLQRARRTLAKSLPDRTQQGTLRALGDARMRELVERYVAAWERRDVAALVAILAEDVTFAMPPYPH